MARVIKQGVFRDGNGAVVTTTRNGTVTVYLAGTTTPASIYSASSGGSAVHYVNTNSSGRFLFYCDTADYSVSQKFDIVLSGTGIVSQTYSNELVFSPTGIITGSAVTVVGDVVTWGDISGSTVDDSGIASANLVTLDGTQTLTNKRLTSPKINENVALSSNSTQLDAAVSSTHTQNTDTGTTATSFAINSGSGTNKYTITTTGLATSKSNDGVDIDDAIAKKHTRSHALDSTSDHSIGSLTNTYLVKSDGSKLLNATNIDSDVASAVSLKHAAVTVSAPISLTGQAISLVNNAVSPATITAIDIGALDGTSDVKIPTSKAVSTAIVGATGISLDQVILGSQIFS
jgi:hypothetical protein